MPAFYTRSGDGGITRLANGRSASKAGLRTTACGELDELNSLLGLAACWSSERTKKTLEKMQLALFHVGAVVAGGKAKGFDVKEVEALADELAKELEHPRDFVLPGGSKASAALQVCRSACRRAERACVRLSETEGGVDGQAIAFLNRLSSLLFAMALFENKLAGEGSRERKEK